MTQLYAKDISADDKQELDEALQREVWIVMFMVGSVVITMVDIIWNLIFTLEPFSLGLKMWHEI